MERLWAPWRMSYIERIEDLGGCFLCEARDNPAKDEENLVLWRGDTVFCIMNRYPYNNGHLMVAPYRHEGQLGAMEVPELAELMEGLVKSQAMLARVVSPHGYNVGLNLGRTAGAGLADHLHFHIVPRWDGDTNFMPVLADVKTIPQALEDLYAQLVVAATESGG